MNLEDLRTAIEFSELQSHLGKHLSSPAPTTHSLNYHGYHLQYVSFQAPKHEPRVCVTSVARIGRRIGAKETLKKRQASDVELYISDQSELGHVRNVAVVCIVGV